MHRIRPFTIHLQNLNFAFCCYGIFDPASLKSSIRDISFVETRSRSSAKQVINKSSIFNSLMLLMTYDLDHHVIVSMGCYRWFLNSFCSLCIWLSPLLGRHTFWWKLVDRVLVGLNICSPPLHIKKTLKPIIFSKSKIPLMKCLIKML